MPCEKPLAQTVEEIQPHHQEIVEFAQAIVDGGASPLAPRAFTPGSADTGEPVQESGNRP
ncbi:hypothetical protein ACFLXI_08865 [Chloroflexota bacterium]